MVIGATELCGIVLSRGQKRESFELGLFSICWDSCLCARNVKNMVKNGFVVV